MGGEKVAGPEGYTFGFFQNYWDIVKSNLLRVAVEFYLNDKVGVCMNTTFISLFPKKDRSIKVKDFHLISSVSSVYKIITKVLATRLSKVLSDTIAKNQIAFIPGRLILDAALVAKEVVENVKSQRKHGLLFELDFQKAYDHVSWGFLDNAMMILNPSLNVKEALDKEILYLLLFLFFF